MRTRRVAVFALWLQREEARLIKRVIVSILYHLVWAFSHAAEEWHCLGSAYGVIQCAVFFSATVRRNIRRQQSLINISSLFVHMGLGTTFQIKMGAYTHSYKHTKNSDASQKFNSGISPPPTLTSKWKSQSNLSCQSDFYQQGHLAIS